MRAKDIMTTPVISIGPQTSVQEIVAILLGQRISGVPVVEQGRLVGIVSEADLIRRREIGTERAPALGWWRSWLADPSRSPSRYVKSRAMKATDLMTRAVVWVEEDTPAAEISGLFESRRIRRVPVVRAGEVVGMISRASLVRALAARLPSAAGGHVGSDEEIRRELLEELESQPWWRSDWSTFTVSDGVVRFVGLIDSPHERHAARVAAENVPGVRRVEDHRKRRADLPLGV
jgi:CBS domain-containing protein